MRSDCAARAASLGSTEPNGKNGTACSSCHGLGNASGHDPSKAGSGSCPNDNQLCIELVGFAYDRLARVTLDNVQLSVHRFSRDELFQSIRHLGVDLRHRPLPVVQR
jgi:hypothetical protein